MVPLREIPENYSPSFNCLYREAGQNLSGGGREATKKGPQRFLSITGSSGFVSWWNLGGLLCVGQIWFSFKAERREENTGDHSLYDCNSRELASKNVSGVKPDTLTFARVWNYGFTR